MTLPFNLYVYPLTLAKSPLLRYAKQICGETFKRSNIFTVLTLEPALRQAGNQTLKHSNILPAFKHSYDKNGSSEKQLIETTGVYLKRSNN